MGDLIPHVGDIVRGIDVGFKDRHPYILHACIDCGKERWVAFDIKPQKAQSDRCRKCATKMFAGQLSGKRNGNWRGGRGGTSRGYINITLQSDDPFYPMTYKGRAMEHRLVMAKHLGRCLQSWEVVHHLNGIKDDNRIENLQLTSKQGHQLSYQDGYAKGLKDGLELRDKQLERQIKLLQWQTKELSEQLQNKLLREERYV